ncbi:hypothetical protein AWB98_02365 [Mycolicibacterium conceptionense]|uniref:Transmembrane protein n=1 Tax=Mycolicibacterium conceptionense TaxID=451644 RepID=A0ABX3UXG7_9MYCO|nr:hypothetical protein AWB98_02365 [Mycolicibacterium conceptionense]
MQTFAIRLRDRDRLVAQPDLDQKPGEREVDLLDRPMTLVVVYSWVLHYLLLCWVVMLGLAGCAPARPI